MKFLLGLTGSIGMGKSTTAKMFKKLGCSVWDADAAVHRAYAPGGSAIPAFQNQIPDAVVNGGVSRSHLKDLISKDPTVLAKVESIIHPLVQKDRADFIDEHETGILVFDIPLLFETGSEKTFDAIACVLTTKDLQSQRVLARPGMIDAHFQMILSKQLPANQKAKKSDYVIPTDTIELARTAVSDIVTQIQAEMDRA